MNTPEHYRIIEVARFTADEFDREVNRINNSGGMSIYIGLIMSGGCAWSIAGWAGIGVVFGLVLFVAGVGLKSTYTLVHLQRLALMSAKTGKQQGD